MTDQTLSTEQIDLFGTPFAKVPLSEITQHKSPFVVSYDDLNVPVYYKAGTGTDLIIYFHGAIQRNTPPPRFQGIALNHTTPHHLSISDPTMLLTKELTAAWYQGTPDLDVPTLLTRMIAELKKQLGITRVIYVGASSGGFAALDFGIRDPGSVAIVGNPQTNLKRHYEAASKAYYEELWKDTCSYEEFLEMERFNLSEKYSKRVYSTVIYIQSTADRFHYFNHYVPFVAALPPNRYFIADVGFWGIMDHSGSTPFNETVNPWLEAVLMSEGYDTTDILMNKRQLDLERVSAPAAPTDGRNIFTKDPPTADISMTKRIRDWQLSEKKV